MILCLTLNEYFEDLKLVDGVPQIVGSGTTNILQSGEFPRLHDCIPCANLQYGELPKKDFYILQSGEYSNIIQSGEARNYKKNHILHFGELQKKRSSYPTIWGIFETL